MGVDTEEAAAWRRSSNFGHREWGSPVGDHSNSVTRGRNRCHAKSTNQVMKDIVSPVLSVLHLAESPPCSKRNMQSGLVIAIPGMLHRRIHIQ